MNFSQVTRLIGLVGVITFSHLSFVNAESSKPEVDDSVSIKTDTQQQTYSKLKLDSSILGESREVFVHLPEGYDSSEKKYPVLYLLDGDRHFPHAITAESILQQESLIPQSIIVAIPNNRGTRTRDLSREKDKFLDFIQNEVIGLIDTQYRASQHKTIFGHSMAGYFVMNILATKPDLFDNYIAASPVIQMSDSELIAKFKEFSLKPEQGNKSLYLTITDQAAEGERATDALNQFVDMMEKKSPDNLSWKYEFIPNQIHMTTPYLTLYSGLSKVFTDYRMPTYTDYKDYKDRGGMQGLKSYYAKRAEKYFTSTQLPERAVRRLGFVLMDDGHANEAVAILEKNIKQYPESAGALNALAEGYENLKQPKKALQTYKAGLALVEKNSPGNVAYFKRQVERMNTQVNTK